jgi:hypothetical protein
MCPNNREVFGLRSYPNRFNRNVMGSFIFIFYGFLVWTARKLSLLLRRVLPPDESLHARVGDCTIRLQNTQGLSDLGSLLRPTSFYVPPIDRGLLSAFSPVNYAGRRLETVNFKRSFVVCKLVALQIIKELPRLCL